MRSILFAAALILPSVAQAQAPAGPVAPTTRWFANFGDAQCIAVRGYGDDQLILKAPAIGDVLQVGLLTAGSKQQAEQTEGRLATDTGESIAVSALVYSPEKTDGKRMHLVNLSRETFNALRPAKTLTWKVGRMERQLKLSGLTPLLKTMDECVSGLRTAWNVNEQDRPEQTAEPGSGTRAKANLARFFRSEDYPLDAVLSKQQGLVGFVLLVNEQGRVADCTVTRTSGVAALDAQSCAMLLERARFTPASDASGKPVRDAVFGRIRWQL